jgi:hypothetical protein
MVGPEVEGAGVFENIIAYGIAGMALDGVELFAQRDLARLTHPEALEQVHQERVGLEHRALVASALADSFLGCGIVGVVHVWASEV